MAFDSGMLFAVADEINRLAADARVEKIQQPQKDEIVITLYCASVHDNLRLAIGAGANNPKISFTRQNKENPQSAPLFCMLLRKQLGGGKLCRAKQYGFERVIELEFACRDEMGFAVTRYLIAEIMGKYSNLILTDGEHKILNAMRTVDFSTSRLRQILPGMHYELPPAQDKENLFDASTADVTAAFLSCDPTQRLSNFIMGRYLGISPLVARELAFTMTGKTDAQCTDASPETVCAVLEGFKRDLQNRKFLPTIVYDAEGKPIEYCFMDVHQYGSAAVGHFQTFCELLDAYFEKRDLAEKIKQRGQDIFRLLTGAEGRLRKKIEIQRGELAACAEGERFKLFGDLLTANLYRLKRGQSVATLQNYYDGDGADIEIPLDMRLTPAQNAQKYYKKYNKCKNAKKYLTEQIEIAENELSYLSTVAVSLDQAETESDLAEIRAELAGSGYAQRMHLGKAQKAPAGKPLEFCTSGGYVVLCGKNNIQNDKLTFKTAAKNDLWFHVKNAPGSHVVLLCDGAEPSETDYTEAATIAATYSKAAHGDKIAVDYTRVKNIKKPPAAKPGYVTYSTNYSAYVTPDQAFCDRLRTSKK